MKTAKIMCLIIVLVAITMPVWAANEKAEWPSADYVIGPGDILDISVTIPQKVC